MPAAPVTVREVEGVDGLDDARRLFRAYADGLPFALDFQGFEAELAGLPGVYARPQGRILLADFDGRAVGSIALRPLEPGVCEMKRMFVEPAARGRGVGRQLAVALLRSARDAGHRVMRLDTVAEMKPAIALYESLGFVRVAPYCHNPLPGATFMELALESVGADGRR